LKYYLTNPGYKDAPPRRRIDFHLPSLTSAAFQHFSISAFIPAKSKGL